MSDWAVAERLAKVVSVLLVWNCVGCETDCAVIAKEVLSACDLLETRACFLLSTRE